MYVSFSNVVLPNSHREPSKPGHEGRGEVVGGGLQVQAKLQMTEQGELKPADNVHLAVPAVPEGVESSCRAEGCCMALSTAHTGIVFVYLYICICHLVMVIFARLVTG